MSSAERADERTRATTVAIGDHVGRFSCSEGKPPDDTRNQDARGLAKSGSSVAGAINAFAPRDPAERPLTPPLIEP
jgi:hypothetical protein